jgi:hypothetical protein
MPGPAPSRCPAAASPWQAVTDLGPEAKNGAPAEPRSGFVGINLGAPARARSDLAGIR